MHIPNKQVKLKFVFDCYYLFINLTSNRTRRIGIKINKLNKQYIKNER